jgi:glycerol-3-phosphate dehydrogenase
LPDPDKVWFGEPDVAEREVFFKQANAMDLDENTTATASEPLSQRLWRRYDRRAFDILEMIKSEPDKANILIEGTEYIRAEVELVAQCEMVTKLEDFLRRRSKIEQVVERDNIVEAAGLKEACRILFADKADEKLAEYIRSTNNT